MITVQTIQDIAELRRLGPAWNALLARSGSDCIFLTWEWISTWWEIFGASHRLLVLVAREGGELRGIAPLMIGRSRRHNRSPLLRRLMFIGQDSDVYPEYLDLIVEAGREAEVVSAFCDAFLGEHRRRWDLIHFERVLEGSPNLPIFRAALAERRLPVELGEDNVCLYLSLPDTLEAFLKERSPNFRDRWRSNRNRLQRGGELRIGFAPADLPVERAFEELRRLNRERFGDAGKSFRTPAYVEMHRRFCELCAEKGWLALCVIEQNGAVLAAKYDFLYAGKVWNNQGGWSAEHQRVRPGEIVMGEVVSWAIRRGAREYDHLGGPADQKKRWSTGQRIMHDDIVVYGTTAAGRLARRVAQARRFAKTHLSPETLDRLRRLRARLRGDAPAPPPPAENPGE